MVEEIEADEVDNSILKLLFVVILGISYAVLVGGWLIWFFLR